ncbi:phage tail sheath family protein [Emergencia sp. 1XD21-10]|uniref:phage tail sheath family protein n=1 Tax=Emergencia sp. 1XD21-10 TaxID=2304569 RepID=UPI00137A4D02|nr:phage tail sheath family protein [Emergencia sp. 1XD21-10]NCE99658.1 phage tail protein [Emergencia sp. 1XD21-10]
MAFGGGIWTAQDKVLPGAYINFISVAAADARLSERGYASMPLELDWGPDGEIFEVTAEDFQNRSLSIFGYDYTHEKLKGLRDLFAYAKVLYAYRLNSGEKAACSYATAKYSGVRGNDLKVIITKNVDDTDKFDVSGYMGTSKLSTQTVAAASELKDDEFFVWKKDAALAETAGTSLTGGTNGDITGDTYQSYLDKAESYSFNVMGIVTNDEKTKKLCTNYVKRMRDEIGVKFQLVMHNAPADFEGVINVKNVTTDANWPEESAVYWVTGAAAGCAVNASNTNRTYDGEFTIDCDYTQTQLAGAIKEGQFTFHRAGAAVRVLQDINSFVSFENEKGELFADNQTIRVIDQIANDDAVLFNTKYLGKVPNDEAGRISLWNDLVKSRKLLNDIRAIEGFTDADIIVGPGESKKSVLVSQQITVIGAMEKLYMTVKVV